MFTLKNKTTFLFLTLCSLILGITLIGALQASTNYEVPSADESKQFVDGLITEAMKISNDPNAGENDFGDLLSSKAVIKEIARFILGSHAREMTPQQLEEFYELYTRRLIRIYSTPEKLRTFRNTRHTMDPKVSKETDGTMLVKTYFYFKESPSSEPAKVYWAVVKKDGKLFVFDIRFEGISKILTERQEYNAIFVDPNKGGGNPAQFLRYLRDQLGAH